MHAALSKTMLKPLLADLARDPLSIVCGGMFAAAGLNPNDFIPENTPEGMFYRVVLFLLFVASVGIRLWRRCTAGRMELVRLHEEEEELRQRERLSEFINAPENTEFLRRKVAELLPDSGNKTAEKLQPKDRKSDS